jgi:hypothetical protein
MLLTLYGFSEKSHPLRSQAAYSKPREKNRLEYEPTACGEGSLIFMLHFPIRPFLGATHTFSQSLCNTPTFSAFFSNNSI